MQKLFQRIVAIAAAVCMFVNSGCNQQPAANDRAEPTTELAPTQIVPDASDLLASEQDVSDRPIQKPGLGGYVSSNACISCHENEHASWHDSYHRTMTQVVTPETVAASFNGDELEYYGWKFRPEKRDDEFWLNIRGTTSSREFDRKLIMMTGSHHMQKYWYPTGNTRELGLAPLVYLMESKQWIPEHTAFLRPTESGLPVREGIWNKGCNQCHATGSQPRIFAADNIDTQVAEFGISCEACHGPGEQHVAEQQAAEQQAAESQTTTAPTRDTSIVNPRDLTAKRSSQVCGQCHGAWVMKETKRDRPWADNGHLYRPGDDLSETRHYIHGEQDEHLLAHVQAEDSFWSDGENRVAGREYNGLINSPCYTHELDDAKRMTCLSCHDMHAATMDEGPTREWANDQLGKKMEGNEACYQCHETFRDKLTDHTHHEANSAGSLCYNCHMPHTSYGLLKAVRSHTITSPSVAASIKTGRPNACNQCHLDQTLDWSARKLNEFYDQPVPELTDQQKYVAASIIWTLKGDAGQRALMAWSMGWDDAKEASGTDWFVVFLTELLFDDYDAVRYIAQRSLKKLPAFQSLEYDHMKAAEDRDRVMGEVMQRWQKMVKGKMPTNPILLYGRDGNLRMDIYQHLRRNRNNRKVVITE